MDLREKEIRAFISRLQQLYLVERNIEGTIELLDESITWIGTGESELINSRNEAERFLLEEKKRFPAGYRILQSDYQIQLLDEEISVVRGVVSIWETGMEGVFESLDLRVTIVCAEKEDRIQATHVHMSVASRDQMETEFFPRVLSGEDTKMLRKLLDEQSMELRYKNKNLNALIGNIPGGVLCCEYSDELELIEYSDRLLDMLGYTREEIRERFDNKFSNMVYPGDMAACALSVKEQLKKSNSKEIEYRMVRKDGKIIRILDQGQLVERDGRDVFYCILTDITEKREAMEELRLSLERHQIIMAQTTDIIFEWDLLKDTLQFSENWYDKFGYEPINEQISVLIPEKGHVYERDMDVFLQMMEQLRMHTPFLDNRIRIRKADGTPIWCRVRVTLQVDENDMPRKAIGVIVDVDEETRWAQKLQEKAERDTLTGLYNKGTTERLARQYIKNITDGETCAFMIIDIDDFKLINDTFGHLSGDVMLVEIASSLEKVFDKEDLIGRIGGDEFAVVLRSVKDKDEVVSKAGEVCSIFNRLLTEEDYTLSCSIGIAFAPESGRDFSSVYRNADLALYQAKATGKNHYIIYDEKIEQLDFPKPKQNLAAQASQPESERTQWTEQFAEYVFSALYESENIEETISRILEIVGRKFNVSRVYIFEDSEDGQHCCNTFEWCNEGIMPQKEELRRISYKMLNYYQDQFDENGFFYSRNILELQGAQNRFLLDRGMKSVLQARFLEKGVKKGFVGFADCQVRRYWTKTQMDTLDIIAKIISVFLRRERLQEQRESRN